MNFIIRSKHYLLCVIFKAHKPQTLFGFHFDILFVLRFVAHLLSILEVKFFLAHCAQMIPEGFPKSIK
jgi:hypothetical protein